MIVVCPNCQARYKFDESRLGDRPRARTRCAKCGGSIEIENPALQAAVPPSPLDELAPHPEPAPPPEPPPPPPASSGPPTAPGPHQIRTAVMARPAPTAQGDSDTVAGKDIHTSGMLELPTNKRFSLAVIQGAATGKIFQIRSTRTTIGRTGNDIDIDDPEASRNHAVVEVLGDQAILRDKGSTNGTWVDGERIEQYVLTNQAEFRIGSHALMFIITNLD